MTPPASTEPLDAVFERFKHMDRPLCDANEKSDFGYFIAGQLWKAIKEYHARVPVQQAPAAENKQIADEEYAAKVHHAQYLDYVSTEPMHCDHECVCPVYSDDQDSYVNGRATHSTGPCACVPCEDDTRARGPVAQQAPTGGYDLRCPRCRKYSEECDCESQAERDAALIAQEREKWERERKASSAVEDITPEGAAIVQKYKAQAREDVLDEVERALESDKCPVKECEGGNCVPCIINSLRSEVGK